MNFRSNIEFDNQVPNSRLKKYFDYHEIKDVVINELAKKCGQNNIPVYSELILGLPGETYVSFIKGIEELLEQSINAQIFIYLCSMLPNTTMDLLEYREKHGIKTVHAPMTEQHYKKQGDDVIKEFEEFIIATNTMSTEGWKKALTFSWTFQFMYSLRTCIYIILYLQFRLGQKPTKFMEFVMKNYCGPKLKSIFSKFKESIQCFLCGGPRDIIMDGSSLYWPVEEVAYVMVAENKQQFYEEILYLLMKYMSENTILYDKNEIHDLIKYQSACMPDYKNTNQSIEFSLQYDFPKYFKQLYQYNENVILQKKQTNCKITCKIYNDRHDFAEKMLVRGRKSDKLLADVKWISESNHIQPPLPQGEGIAQATESCEHKAKHISY